MKTSFGKIFAAGVGGALTLVVDWAELCSSVPFRQPDGQPVEASPVRIVSAAQGPASLVAPATCSATNGSAITPDLSPTPRRPAWVDLLLTNGAATVPYQDLTPLSREMVGELIARFQSLPPVPFTNRAGIARALAFIGDERVVDMYRRALFQDYQGLRLSRADGDLLPGLLLLTGHLASRYDTALDLLKPGLAETYWRTNITWTLEGDSPVGLLVSCTIRGLALCGKREGWDRVVQKRQTADPEYLKLYASEMVDAAARWATIRDHGRDYLMTHQGRAGFDLFVQWARTKEGLEWRRWEARIEGRPVP